MLAYQELQRFRVHGLAFSMRHGKLAVEPRERITDAIRDTIRSRRDEFVQLIEAESYPPSPHDIGERAAILEFDGGYSRGETEAMALTHFGYVSWEELAVAQARTVRCEP